MNRFQTTFRSIAAAGVAALVLAVTPAAHAGGSVSVSIGGLPLPPLPPLPGLPGLRIEAPRVVVQAPVVVAEPRVVVAPAPRVVYTAPVVVGRGWGHPREVRYVRNDRDERCDDDRGGRDGWRRNDRWDERRDGRWERDERRQHHDHDRDERRTWR